MLDAFGVFEPTPTTYATLVGYLRATRSARKWFAAHNLYMGVACCPEVHLA